MSSRWSALILSCLYSSDFHDYFLDSKPTNSTRFEYFTKIIRFNETGNNLLADLLSNFKSFMTSALDTLTLLTDALENLLMLSPFTTE